MGLAKVVVQHVGKLFFGQHRPARWVEGGDAQSALLISSKLLLHLLHLLGLPTAFFVGQPALHLNGGDYGLISLAIATIHWG